MINIKWMRKELMIKNQLEPVRVEDAILDFQSRLEKLETKHNIPFKHRWNYNLLLNGRELQKGKVTEALLEFQKRINVLKDIMLSNVSVTLNIMKSNARISGAIVLVDGVEYVSDGNGVVEIPVLREGLYRVYAKKDRLLRGVEYIAVVKDKSTAFDVELKITR